MSQALDPIIIDGRDLQPPEPLELTLEALDRLQPGQEIVLLLHCEPQPLYSILRRNGYTHTSVYQPDGTHEVHICKA